MRPNDPSTDDMIDNLLQRMPVRASDDFAARTLARMHQHDATVEDHVERLLREQPARPSADFTRRTVARATRRQRMPQTFAMPLAAAAAAAFAFITLWNQPAGTPQAGGDAMAAQPTPAAAERMAGQDVALTELVALADGLNDAAPLLDPDAADALAALTSWSR